MGRIRPPYLEKYSIDGFTVNILYRDIIEHFAISPGEHKKARIVPYHELIYLHTSTCILWRRFKLMLRAGAVFEYIWKVFR